MLRRIRWWLRLFLLLLGATAVAAVPLSLICQTRMHLFVPRGELVLTVEDASVKGWAFPPGTFYSHKPHLVEFRQRGSRSLDHVLAWSVFPTGKRVGAELYFTLPLWLLAFLCLAWPVTSFLVARRRRRLRGFEVEAKGGSAVSTVDS